MTMMRFLGILWARKWIMLATLVVTLTTTIIVSKLLPEQYTASSTLMVDFKGADPVVGAMVPSQLMPGYVATQVGILSSKNVALRVVDNLKLVQSPVVQQQFSDDANGQGDIRDWLAGVLLKRLKIEPSRESNLIEVSFAANDPQFAAAITNAFVQAYVQANLDLRTGPARQNNLWYQEQIKDARAKLEDAQKRLSDYQRQKGIVAVDERLDVENSRLAELSSQLVAAQAQTYDSVSRNHRSGEQLTDVMNNPLIQGLKADLARGESALVQISEKLGKNHPNYLRAQADVETLRNKLNQEIRNAQTGVNTNMKLSQQRESELRASLAAQKAKVLALKQQRDEGAVLERDVESAQGAYDLVLQRSTQTHMESRSTLTDIAVLNPAVAPLKPSSPNMLLNILVATVLGLMLATAFAWLAELFDRRVRTEADFVEILGAPVLVNLMHGLGTPRRGWLPRLT